MTRGIPSPTSTRFSAWCGDRLAFWARGIPQEKLVGIFSSRLTRRLDRHRGWFAALRTACLRIDSRRERLLAVATTTTARFVERCAALFGLPLLTVEVAEESDPAVWCRRVMQEHETESPWPTTAACDRLLLSPPLAPATADAPIADCVLAALSDRLIGLAVREGGHWQRLAQRRLADPAFAPGSFFLAIGRPGGEDEEPVGSPRLAEPLMQAGAVGWLLQTPASTSAAGDPPPWHSAESAPAAVAADLLPAAIDQEKFLTHCTRSRHGPWPNQTEADFLDDLILDRAGADHSALAALCRITSSQRLVATADFVRGETPVISFTAVPLAELPSLRAFRPHLARWDFEPYGICLRRDWLEQRGSRPVIYGDESTRQSLPLADQPFFQRAKSTSPSGRVEDWTREREWRHCGDVDLSQATPGDVFLFVPSATEAAVVAGVSRWPVMLAE